MRVRAGQTAFGGVLLLARGALRKARGHKYLRREATGDPQRPWHYIYRDEQGREYEGRAPESRAGDTRQGSIFAPQQHALVASTSSAGIGAEKSRRQDAPSPPERMTAEEFEAEAGALARDAGVLTRSTGVGTRPGGGAIRVRGFRVDLTPAGLREAFGSRPNAAAVAAVVRDVVHAIVAAVPSDTAEQNIQEIDARAREQYGFRGSAENKRLASALAQLRGIYPDRAGDHVGEWQADLHALRILREHAAGLRSGLRKAAGDERAGHAYTSRRATGNPKHPWAYYYYGTEEHQAPQDEASTYDKESRQRGERGGVDLFAGTKAAAQARTLAPMGDKGAAKLRADVARITGMRTAEITPGPDGKRVSGFVVVPHEQQWAEVRVEDYERLHKQAGVDRKTFEVAAIRKVKTLLAAEGYTFNEARAGQDAGRVFVARFVDVGGAKSAGETAASRRAPTQATKEAGTQIDMFGKGRRWVG